MSGTCVVGLQWGDEAKGKIVDLLSADHHFVVRYNGGANAGHTIVRDGKTFKLSLMPSGVLHPHMHAVIGNGLVIFPPKVLQEIEQLRQGGVELTGRFSLSAHAHVIFPYHMEEERMSEQAGEGSIGTTGRGIGPCYQDKVSRVHGIRLGDLLKPDFLRERLRFVVPRKNRIIHALANGTIEAPRTFCADELAHEYLGYAEQLRPYITDTAALLHQGIQAGKRILFEAAQGSLLDIDHGTYPYVTSSSSLPSGIWSGSGVPAKYVSRVVGVIKAYSTRVGRGPFPTELTDGPTGIGERIRQVGREYGTVTGRPRRVGWLDSVALRYTARLAGVDEVTLMLLDVLSGLPEVRICVGYHCAGERIDTFPADAEQLERCQPIYETLPGWATDISTVRKLTDLPQEARRYIDRVSELVGVKVSVISVGPDRAQTIVV